MNRAVVVEIDPWVGAPGHIGADDRRVGDDQGLGEIEAVGLAVEQASAVEVYLHVVQLRRAGLARNGRAAVDPDDVDVAVLVDIHVRVRAPAVTVGQTRVVDQYEVADCSPAAAVLLPDVVQGRADVLHVLPGDRVYPGRRVAGAPVGVTEPRVRVQHGEPCLRRARTRGQLDYRLDKCLHLLGVVRHWDVDVVYPNGVVVAACGGVLCVLPGEGVLAERDGGGVVACLDTGPRGQQDAVDVEVQEVEAGLGRDVVQERNSAVCGGAFELEHRFLVVGYVA